MALDALYTGHKNVKVIPVYKSGDSDIVSNYRPVSVLPAISNIFERLVYNKIVYFC